MAASKEWHSVEKKGLSKVGPRVALKVETTDATTAALLAASKAALMVAWLV